MQVANTHSQDIISGDEIISDSFDPVLVDDVVYEVDCAMITEGAVSVSKFALPRYPILDHETNITIRHWCQRFR